MNRALEKILKKIEEIRNKYQRLADGSNFDGWNGEDIKYSAKAEMCEELKEIVQEVAEEYNNGWIPCSDDSAKLPKENEKVRVTVWTGIEKIGFMQYGKWFVYSSEGVAEATVVAWQPTEPYRVE